MAMEDKRDNKVDTNKNGRPVSFSTGEGEDFFIDLPQSIPGEETTNPNDMDSTEIDNLIGDINSTNKEIEDLLKEMGIDDINNIGKGDY